MTASAASARDRRRAAIGTAAFAVAPATVAGLAFVRLYEEPVLTRKFGAEYDEYRRNVPRWLPRLTPWRPEGQESPRR